MQMKDILIQPFFTLKGGEKLQILDIIVTESYEGAFDWLNKS